MWILGFKGLKSREIIEKLSMGVDKQTKKG